MPKFSLIVPIYKTEDYLKKCLDSIFMQSYKDFEVICVLDGENKKASLILEDYDVVVIHEKNMGLSYARNNGIKNSRGEYLVFIDSDDYIDKDLLKNVNKSLSNNPDLVRFQVREVFDNNKSINYKEKIFQGLNGKRAFDIISSFHFVENAWCYVYKKEYFIKNKFKFRVGYTHEDFGLVLLVILKASKVNSINYIGYNYYMRDNSIMNNKNYKYVLKKTDDFYTHYLYLMNEVKKIGKNNKIFKSFIANSL